AGPQLHLSEFRRQPAPGILGFPAPRRAWASGAVCGRSQGAGGKASPSQRLDRTAPRPGDRAVAGRPDRGAGGGGAGLEPADAPWARASPPPDSSAGAAFDTRNETARPRRDRAVIRAPPPFGAGRASGSLDLGRRLLGSNAPALGALGEHLGDALDGAALVQLLDRRDFAGHAIERRLVELALGVGLLRLALGPVEIADDLRDRNQIAGVDLGLVLLCAPAPHRALDPRPALERLHGPLHHAFLGELAHAHALRLARRHAQRHLVLLEGDDEQLERHAGDL